MNLIQLEVQGLSNSQTNSGAFALVLGESKGRRKLPIVIGSFEAKAIAIALDNEFQSQRPITHDLFKSLCDGFDITIFKVVISSVNADGIFSSVIYTKDKNENLVELDSRTSDAVAIAIRFNAPIFVYENILNEAGIILNDDVNGNENKNDKSAVSELNKLSIEELKSALTKAIDEENYELASKYRDELKSREGK